MINVELVPVQTVDGLWPVIAPMVTKGLQKTPSDLTCGSLWSGCRAGTIYLVVASEDQQINAATFWRFSGQDYFECVLIVGSNADKWFKETWDFGLSIAKANGCKATGGMGRKGWIKLFKRFYPRVKTPRMTFVVECE